MKQSEYDPTLREHFTEKEARNWIRHLEKVIESLELKLKRAKGLNGKFSAKNTALNRKYKRLMIHIEYLQEEHPDIDFGLESFR